MKKGILFDLDGTLLDTLQDLTDAVNYVLPRYGYPTRTTEQIRQAISTGARNLIIKSMEGKADDATIDRALADYQAYYSTHCQIKTRPYEGVLEALERLKQVCPVGIVSNKPDQPVKLLCADYFGDIYALGEQAGRPRKPAPDMIRRAMEQLGIDSCIYVGDSDVDVLTAKNVGMPVLCVLWGFRDRQQLEAVGAENFCDDPSKLADTLLSMLEESNH